MIVLFVVITLFGIGAILGAPWLPTFDKQSDIALDLLDLKPGMRVVDLGSGSGSFARAAAKRGLKVTGYEINVLLFGYSLIRTWQYRSLVTIKLRNYWQVKLPQCDGVYVFLIARYMTKLDKKINQEAIKPLKLVSYIFEIPEKLPVAKKAGFYLYQYHI